MHERLIGVLGGGQLGRMLALAGYALGARFRFLEPAPEPATGDLAETLQGAYADEEALARFSQGLGVVTYEFENVPVAVAERLERSVPVYPPPRALALAQDRLIEKEFLRSCGVATAPYCPVNSPGELLDAVGQIGLPAVLKTRRLGYDGKGQIVLRERNRLPEAWEAIGGGALILEGYTEFTRELSVLAVRARDGTAAFYPLVENHHRDGILRLSLAPAPRSGDLQSKAEAIARSVLVALQYVGVLAIELFETDGQLLANEMAPRVHNSGHWTIEGADTSQFANHVRAIVGLPLGSTGARGLSAMVNLIGTLPDASALLKVPGANLHVYGKAPRPGRKLGHVTLLADTEEQLRARVSQVLSLCNGDTHDLQSALQRG